MYCTERYGDGIIAMSEGVTDYQFLCGDEEDSLPPGEGDKKIREQGSVRKANFRRTM